jgi:hypothetical protein
MDPTFEPPQGFDAAPLRPAGFRDRRFEGGLPPGLQLTNVAEGPSDKSREGELFPAPVP